MTSGNVLLKINTCCNGVPTGPKLGPLIFLDVIVINQSVLCWYFVGGEGGGGGAGVLKG